VAAEELSAARELDEKTYRQGLRPLSKPSAGLVITLLTGKKTYRRFPICSSISRCWSRL
jgi:hypothetical protein